MLRVAIVAGKVDSGGKKNLIMEYFRHIDRNRIQFDFICDEDSQAIPYEEIEELGGRVYLIAPYQKIFRNMHDMKKIFNQNDYKIVHAYNSTMNLFPMFVAKLCRIPIRISESLSMSHSGDKKTILKKLLRPMSRWFANRFMACGEDCGRWQFGNNFFDSGKVEVFKTAINTDFNSFDKSIREKTREEYGWTDKLVIGHIGRFTVQKNSIQMIDIFAAVAHKEPNAILCLIGDGELKEEMKKRIIHHGIEEQVCYLGRREDIQQFYNAMDGFILPSLYEGLPVVGLEAQSCGLPVFFSTEVTREASACELCQFIPLDKQPEYWADIILEECKKVQNSRQSHAQEVAKAGFDSIAEAKRLQMYYENSLENIK